MKHKVPQQRVCHQSQIKADETFSPSSPSQQILLCKLLKVTEFANNSNYGSRVFIGTEIGFSVPAVQRSVFNKQQTQSHQLCWGSLDIFPFPGTVSSFPEVPALPPSSNQCLKVSKGGHRKKKITLFIPCPSTSFQQTTAQLSALSQ